MVIECAQCHTRFRLADDKVKPGGTRVRCSKCKHIFRVLPPQPEPVPAPEVSTEQEEVDFGDFNMERVPDREEVAGFRLPRAEERTETPHVSDTGSEPSENEPAFSLGFDENPPHREDVPPDREEVSFSDEPGAGLTTRPWDEEDSHASNEPAPGEEESPGTLEFSLGEEESESPAEFSFGGREEAETAGEISLEGRKTGEPAEFSFEEQDSEEPGEFSYDEEGTAGDFSFDDADASFDAEEEPAWSGEAPFLPEDSLAGEAGKETGDFDFSGMTFGEEAEGTVFPGGSEEPPFPESEPFPATPEPPASGAAPDRDIAALRRVQPQPTRKRRNPFRGVLIFVILLLLALCGIAGYFYLQGEAPDLMGLADRIVSLGSQPATKGEIRVEGLTGTFVNNRDAGQLFVIRGKVVNDYPEARSAISLKGILYDKAGKPVLQQTVFAGNPLDETAVRDRPFTKIEESMHNQFGDSLSNLNVASGKSIPFTIVFRNLPADLAEFTVEVADSKPGTRQ
jgi:predicted Zn finger-like uncharacterized protein